MRYQLPRYLISLPKSSFKQEVANEAASWHPARKRVKEGGTQPRGMRNIYDKLRTLIRNQFADERSVSDVVTTIGTPLVSVGILDSGEITATIFGPEQSETEDSSPDAVRKFDNNTLF